MKNKQSKCLTVALSEDQLIVVGGLALHTNKTDSPEIVEDN